MAHAPAGERRPDDAAVVSGQLEREPRTPWRVATRCRFGRPSTIASPPRLADGTPFPTVFWLTCPWLREHVAAEESAGRGAAIAERIAADPELARRVREADARYRAARGAEGGGDDPLGDVGIAGQKDPLATKCLHAHVAAELAGVHDPVGELVLGELAEDGWGAECDDDRCAAWALGRDAPTGQG